MKTFMYKLHTNTKLDRWDLLLAMVSFIGGLILYICTLTPGLLCGDSGEFQTLAHLLGNTHPTGYPIYLVMAKLATLLPLGDIAYRVNLFSALMGGLTVAGVYLSGRMLVKYRSLALIGAVALAVSPTYWSQAVIAEVYTTGSAFSIGIVLALLCWARNENSWTLFLAGLLGGLSLGVHMSVALLAPAVLLFILWHWRRGRKMWTTALLGAAVGVIITVFIFWLIDLHDPAANYFNSMIEPSRSAWGLTADKIDGPFERLSFGWSARQFRSFMFADVAKVMPEQAAGYWQNLPFEMSWLLIIFAILGAVYLLFQWTRVGVLLIMGLTIQLAYVFNYEMWDLYVFYIPSYILLFLLSIVGMSVVADLGMAAIRKITSSGQIRWLRLVNEGVIALLVLGFGVWPIFLPQIEAFSTGEVPFKFDDYPVFDEYLQDTAYAMVIELPESAVVFTDWDMVWPYYYAAYIVEGSTDLVFIETYPADDLDGIADSVIDYVITNLGERPIYFSEREPSLLEAGFTFVPARVGPTRLYRVLMNNEW